MPSVAVRVGRLPPARRAEVAPAREPSIRDHETFTRPVGLERAPCLTAFVASSCRISARDCVSSGTIQTGRPSVTTLLPDRARNGDNTSAARSARLARPQAPRRSSVCARDIARMRPSSASTKAPTEVARWLDRCAMAPTLLRMFFTRWSSSAISRRWRSSASLRSVMSRMVPVTRAPRLPLSWTAWPRSSSQRISPSARAILNSSSRRPACPRSPSMCWHTASR